MKYTKYLLGLSLFVLGGIPIQAQTPPAQALTNVTLHHADGTVTPKASIVWRNGIIEAVGANLSVPFDAKVTDGGDSLHVYPGFLDGLATFGSPDLPSQQPRPSRPGEPTYERAGIQPERLPSAVFKKDDAELGQANSVGFVAAALAPKGFMLPGGVEVFHINGAETENHLFKSDVAVVSQFVQARGVYPSTLMSIMARFRQLWSDASALQEHQKLYNASPDRYDLPARDAVLEALFPLINKERPIYFVADNKEDIRRVFALQDELGFNLVLVSAKEAYAVADEIKRRNVRILASLNITDKPDWIEKDAKDSVKVASLSVEEVAFRASQKAAWEAERDNIKKLLAAGIPVGYASYGLKPTDFRKKMSYLVEGGLTEAQLLNVLTTNTAVILGVPANLGQLRRGHIASFAVFSSAFTEKDARVTHLSVAGNIKEITNASPARRGRR